MYFGTMNGTDYGWYRAPVMRCVAVTWEEYQRLLHLNRNGYNIIPDATGYPVIEEQVNS